MNFLPFALYFYLLDFEATQLTSFIWEQKVDYHHGSSDLHHLWKMGITLLPGQCLVFLYSPCTYIQPASGAPAYKIRNLQQLTAALERVCSLDERVLESIIDLSIHCFVVEPGCIFTKTHKQSSPCVFSLLDLPAAESRNGYTYKYSTLYMYLKSSRDSRAGARFVSSRVR